MSERLPPQDKRVQERLGALLAEAEALAARFRAPDIAAPSSAHTLTGGAGRRRGGTGETFWQYRRYRQEDSAERIDWRRSSKSDRLYVRDTELETARHFAFWLDQGKGFDWASRDSLPTKRDRALVLLAAVAGIVGRAGERCRVLGAGRTSVSGRSALNRVGQDLASLPEGWPPASRQGASLILASDFYDTAETLSARIRALGRGAQAGVLLRVIDPAEADFSYSGRVRFEAPGSSDSLLFGRAQAVRQDYLERFQAHSAALGQVANALGWPIVDVSTDTPAATGLAALMRATQALGEAQARRFSAGPA